MPTSPPQVLLPTSVPSPAFRKYHGSASPPEPAEVERARNTFETHLIEALEKQGGFGGVADRLNTYNQYVGTPDYLPQDLEEIAQRMLQQMQYRLSASGVAALHDYIPLRMRQPHFANARSIRNALDRARLRQANRLFAEKGRQLTRDELMTIEGADLRASRVFS